MNDIKQKLVQVLAEALPNREFGEIAMADRLVEDLQLSSLDLMVLAFQVEEAFDITFGDDFEPDTVEDLCALILRQTGNA
ncbi:MAG: acyl carrier protein [Clostridia bacterium]|nr:acyl carrier protein [Clostridia bacterium]